MNVWAFAFSLLLMPATDDLDDLRKLSGVWVSEDGRVEEHWMAPAFGVMVGMNRDTSRGKAFFEYLRIEVREDDIYYVASPRGKGETAFRLTERGEHRWVFENPEHDFPQKIVYELTEPDKLCARVEADGKGFGWCWRRKGR